MALVLRSEAWPLERYCKVNHTGQGMSPCLLVDPRQNVSLEVARLRAAVYLSELPVLIPNVQPVAAVHHSDHGQHFPKRQLSGAQKPKERCQSATSLCHGLSFYPELAYRSALQYK